MHNPESMPAPEESDPLKHQLPKLGGVFEDTEWQFVGEREAGTSHEIRFGNQEPEAVKQYQEWWSNAIEKEGHTDEELRQSFLSPFEMVVGTANHDGSISVDGQVITEPAYISRYVDLKKQKVVKIQLNARINSHEPDRNTIAGGIIITEDIQSNQPRKEMDPTLN